MNVRRWAWWCACGLALAVPARAQDFAGARGVLDADGAAALLDAGLADARPLVSLEAAQVAWWNVPELKTRALAAGVAWRSVRLAVGASQTGVPELGWQSAAFGVGAASREAAVALRVLGRRDAASGGSGAECGGGAWLRLADGVRLVASAPQLGTTGASPPLARPLVAGLAADAGLAAAWLALEAPRPRATGERLLGASLDVAGARVWAEARGAPWRVACGLRAASGPLRVGLRVESHPALGETTMLSVALARGAERP